MSRWFEQAVLSSSEECPEELRGWVLGRGLSSALFDEMQIGCWKSPSTPSKDPEFDRRNGVRGTYREGWLVIPYWSPRGDILGAEFRTWGTEEKKVRDFRLPRSKNCPTFMGLTPQVFQKIWEGGSVWLVEGVFDLSLSHVIPEEDVALACGTARLTWNQLQFLIRFLKPPACVFVVFDEDPTGRSQVEGFVDEKTGKFVPGIMRRLQKAKLACQDVRYRGGKDPGEIWEDGGRSALQNAIRLYSAS